MWITGFTLIFLTFLLPETMEANILLKRAQRLRKLTGNENLRSQSEIDMSHINKKAFLYETLVQPFVLAFEPTLLFANVFLGLVCKSPVGSLFMDDRQTLTPYLFRLRVLPMGTYEWIYIMNIITDALHGSLRHSLWYSMICMASTSGLEVSPTLHSSLAVLLQ